VPLPLPNLDDQPYADLAREARARIPSLVPSWTDHNESDPGIVLVELFAWLTEMLNYQINQVPDESYWAFLALLGAEIPPAPPGGARPVDLEGAIRDTVLAQREPHRAASASDYEELACVGWNRSRENSGRVRQARCFPDCNLDADPSSHAPGHVSLVIVADTPPGLPPQPPTDGLCQGLRAWLEPRRMLGVALHVVGWRPVTVEMSGTLVVRRDYAPAHRGARLIDDRTVAQAVKGQAIAALQQYVNPLTGGADGRGWPLDRDLYLSECYAVLCRVPGVDYVQDLRITRVDNGLSAPVIPLQPCELPVIAPDSALTTVISRGEAIQ
jgi:hypothetical protein